MAEGNLELQIILVNMEELVVESVIKAVIPITATIPVQGIRFALLAVVLLGKAPTAHLQIPATQ